MITVASVEQAKGIEQIRQTVVEIDNIAQENAAKGAASGCSCT